MTHTTEQLIAYAISGLETSGIGYFVNLRGQDWFDRAAVDAAVEAEIARRAQPVKQGERQEILVACALAWLRAQ